ncbi:alpha/beta-hydrolase family protein [Corynebacterium atrinae]|uniref:alpha/beta-hydrolase family protein n=1 Tax=Corynebacterium atrinae TaxID=1336740 RepID=UPI0025B44678|nr:alpha/beta-hydrolase family protein [Corynebacterium atrinae]
MGSTRSFLLRGLARGAVGALKGTAFALAVVADITPGLRMTKRRHFSERLLPGIVGAEIATWWAVSPSLLPRPWWAIAANVAVCQGVGHAIGTGAAWTMSKAFDRAGHRPQRLITLATLHAGHLAIASITVAAAALSLRRQDQQSQLVGLGHLRGAKQAAVGAAVGTAGYGALLLLGEAAQLSVDRLGRRLSRIMPPWLGWPLATMGVAGAAFILSDRLLMRRIIARLARRAAHLNQAVFPGVAMPWEPERSGSPWSRENWTRVGAQGRAVLALGPRARDIAKVTGLEEVHEPIRIFVGLVPGRSFASATQQVLAEMDRTGAFRRDTLVIQTSTGTGWITDWSVDAVEFLTGGNCATMSMQYSYLPSAVSYYLDRDTPVRASRILVAAVLSRLEQMDPDDRPKLYVAGESLGAYGMVTAFEDLEDLLTRVDGAVFSGAPRFTRLTQELTATRDAGSPERLPIVDGGKHVRFTAHESHLTRDFNGLEYRNDWLKPKIIFAQHASDPIVWWDIPLIWRRPAWLTEPGTRGRPAPRAQRLDVVTGIRWIPFITSWQIGLDQLTSNATAGGHGHNYHEEMLWYWDAVLGADAAVRLAPSLAAKAAEFIRRDSVIR